MKVVQFTLFSLIFASQNALADMQLNMTQGVTPISHDIYHLHMTILYVCIAIGFIVFCPMFYALFAHRKSRNAKAANFHEHLWLEITWTIIPFIVLILMAIPATNVLIHLNNTDKPSLTIKITGYQWKWRYEYLDHGIQFFSNIIPNQKTSDPNYLRSVDRPLVIPIHQKIRFLTTSNDVVHSWWVPAFGVKRDAVPGFITESWARVNRPGVYHGQCAELCGVNHAFMPIVVIALAQKDFDNWVIVQKGGTPLAPVPITIPGAVPAAAPATPRVWNKEELMKRGEQVYLNTCAVCHKPDGTGTPPTFPALKGSAITTGVIAKHIDIVLNGKPGTAMQAFRDQLPDEDIASVITYERNSWGNNKGDMLKPEDIKAARGSASTTN